MNKQQAIHVGMVNSFNVLTDRVELDEVVYSGIGIFAHVPDEDITKDVFNLILLYFQEHEMFEHCAELIEYYNENFNDDGSVKEEECDCEFPEIAEYLKKMKCSYCKKRLKR